MPNDYLIDYTTGRMKKANGDFVMGESTVQHQRRLLKAQQGEYKQNPLVGVGVDNSLDDEDPDDLIREVRKQYVQDGMTVDVLKITATGIAVDAHY